MSLDQPSTPENNPEHADVLSVYDSPAELEAKIAEAMAELRAGKGIPWEDVRAEIERRKNALAANIEEGMASVRAGRVVSLDEAWAV